MSIIQEIEAALIRINDAKFQEFCNDLLFYKFNPNSITPIGSVVGKEKTRKGIPDCYLKLENGDLIFAEYTTQNGVSNQKALIEKLKKDITSCFDKKNEISFENISQLILCFTGKLTPKEHNDLEVFCKSFNSNCIFTAYGIRDLAKSAQKYPSLASNYLGISIGIHQIMSPADFVSFYEKSKHSTSIHNKFLGRKQELKSALEKLESNDVLIITGPPGVGKSRLALESCKEYCEIQAENFEFLCLADKGIPVWDELKTLIRNDKNYVFMVDDANRMAQNYQFILSLLKEERSGVIKIVATARDYAFKVLQYHLNDDHFEKLVIDRIENDEIEKILRSEDFGISNPKAIKRILSIAQGNARMAIMCAKIEDDKLVQLANPSQVYDACFSEIIPLINNLADSRHAWKVLGAITFCRSIKKKNIQKDIYVAFDIDENSFWEICEQLCELEIIDLFENVAVKISDQVLSTYLFHEIFFKLKYVDYRVILEYFLDYSSHIIDSINPVILGFGSDKIIDDLKKETLLPFWNKIRNDESRAQKFLKLFFSGLPTQAIAYYSELISNLPVSSSKNYIFDYGSNDFPSYNRDPILEVLQEFRSLEEYRQVSLQLICMYGEKKEEKASEIAYTLDSGFGFQFDDIEDDFIVQHNLVDLLIERSNKSEFCKLLALVVFAKLMQTNNLYDTKSGNGRSLIFQSYQIPINQSYLDLRSKIWNFLILVFSQNKSETICLIEKIVLSDTEKKAIQFDSSIVLSFLTSILNPKEYTEARFANEYFSILKRNKIPIEKELIKNFQHPLYGLFLKICPPRNGIDHDTFEKLKKKKLVDLCLKFKIQEYKSLLEDIKLIKSHDNLRNEYTYEEAINIILEDLVSKDQILFNQFLVYLIENSIIDHLKWNKIFDSYFSHRGDWEQLYDILTINIPSNTLLLLSYYTVIPQSIIKEKNLSARFYNDLIQTLKTTQKHLHINRVDFLEKFEDIKPLKEIYIELCEVAIFRSTKDNFNLKLGGFFYQNSTQFIHSNLDLYSQVYLMNRKIDDLMDLDGKVLSSFLEKDPHFFCVFFDAITDQSGRSHMSRQEVNSFWSHPKQYDSIFNLVEYIVNENKQYKGRRFLSELMSESQYKEQILVTLERLVDENYSKSKMVKLIFDIIPSSPKEFGLNLLKKFLVYNNDFNVFLEIELLRKPLFGLSSNGSKVPSIEKDKTKLKEVLKLINLLPNKLSYIKHLEYLENRINGLEINIRETIEREFLEYF